METNLCIAGFGGQGVMTLGKFLASATCDSTDKNVTFFPSYGAEQRGGTANCFVVISDEMVGAPLGDVMDDLIVMNGPSLKKFLPTLKEGGNLFINSSIVTDEIDREDVTVVKAPVTEMALEMGNPKVLNVIMLGVYVGYTEVVSPEVVWSTIEHKLAGKQKLLPLNKEAFEKGLEIRRKQKESDKYFNHIVQYPPEVSLCAGCTSCEAVCSMVHDGTVSPSLSRIQVERGTVSMIHTIHTCQQCKDHPCYNACPKKDKAMCIDEKLGICYVNPDECVGCRLCVKACPFEPKRIRINLDKPRGKAFKCDMCRTRPEGPACLEFCQVRCIGNSEDPVPVDDIGHAQGLF